MCEGNVSKCFKHFLGRDTTGRVSDSSIRGNLSNNISRARTAATVTNKVTCIPCLPRHRFMFHVPLLYYGTPLCDTPPLDSSRHVTTFVNYYNKQVSLPPHLRELLYRATPSYHQLRGLPLQDRATDLWILNTATDTFASSIDLELSGRAKSLRFDVHMVPARLQMWCVLLEPTPSSQCSVSAISTPPIGSMRQWAKLSIF